MFLYSFQTPTMLVNGKAFDGTIDYEVTDETLRLRTGKPYIVHHSV